MSTFPSAQFNFRFLLNLARGYGAVDLPYALALTGNGSGNMSFLQPVFQKISEMGSCGGFIPVPALQRAVRRAGQWAGLNKRVTCYVFRRSFATHLLANGYDTLRGHCPGTPKAQRCENDDDIFPYFEPEWFGCAQPVRLSQGYFLNCATDSHVTRCCLVKLTWLFLTRRWTFKE
jgi:hypothetical protein